MKSNRKPQETGAGSSALFVSRCARKVFDPESGPESAAGLRAKGLPRYSRGFMR